MLKKPIDHTIIFIIITMDSKMMLATMHEEDMPMEFSMDDMQTMMVDGEKISLPN
jgi:hypothetical protein